MGERTLLTPSELKPHLKTLKGWKVSGKSLVRTFKFKSYLKGLDFAVRLGRRADKADHHPDLKIGYGKVAVRWTTHDAGGITSMDIAGAKMTNSVVSSQ